MRRPGVAPLFVTRVLKLAVCLDLHLHLCAHLHLAKTSHIFIFRYLSPQNNTTTGFSMYSLHFNIRPRTGLHSGCCSRHDTSTLGTMRAGFSREFKVLILPCVSSKSFRHTWESIYGPCCILQCEPHKCQPMLVLARVWTSHRLKPAGAQRTER